MTHHMVTCSRTGSLRRKQIFNLSNSTDISLLLPVLLLKLYVIQIRNLLWILKCLLLCQITSGNFFLLLLGPTLSVVDGFIVTSLIARENLIVIKVALLLKYSLNSLSLISIIHLVPLSSLPPSTHFSTSPSTNIGPSTNLMSKMLSFMVIYLRRST